MLQNNRNYVSQFLTQQQGKRCVRTYDGILEHLSCCGGDDSNSIWGSDEFAEHAATDPPIFACKFANKQGSGHLLALANEDGTLVIHNTEHNATLRRGENIHHNAIFDLAWLADSFKLITVSGDNTARLVDVEADITTTHIFSGHTRSVKSVATRDDDPATFATGSRDGSIRVWDTRTSQHYENFLVQSDRTIAHSHCRTPTSSHKRKAAASQAVTAANSVTGLVFQDDDKLISCSSGDGVIKMWDLRKTYASGKPTALREIAYSGNSTRNGFSNLLIDPNRRRLYANCLDNTIYAYNVGTYNPVPVMEYKGHQNGTFYVKAALSGDGQYLLSGSSDHVACVWNIDSQDPFLRLVGHSAEVTCVAWRAEGMPTLVTCSDDVTHKIWRVNARNDDNADNEGGTKGQAEYVPVGTKILQALKRRLEDNENTPVRAKLSRLEFAKRKLEGGATPEAKRSNSGRRLFALQERKCNNDDPIASTSSNNDLATILEEETNDDEVFKTPKASAIHKARTTPEDAFSPTTNLPNFVVDGSAPHLHFSPQKRLPKDWLTKMRVERTLLSRGMHEFGADPSSPKMPRLDHEQPGSGPSPSSRQRTPKRRSSRSGSSGSAAGQSPILKFFRVTNSNILNNTMCSPKSPSVRATTSSINAESC